MLLRKLLGKIKHYDYSSCKIRYIGDHQDWSVLNDAKMITGGLNKKYGNISKVQFDYNTITNAIVHFGSRYKFLNSGYTGMPNNCRPVMTYFHGTHEESELNKRIENASKRASLIHTSCTLTRDLLLHYGAEEEKIKVIPLGVDLQQFKPREKAAIEKLKIQLNIEPNRFIIGSFQKDGEGWEEGLVPKMIKGPDVFCDTIEKLAKEFPIHILLSGPARGYVINRLTAAGIPYTSLGYIDFNYIPKYFPLCDLYIIASRAEGGPKAVLESLASGVPLVSTRVGMSNDILEHGKNAFVTDCEDVEGLALYSAKILGDKMLSDSFKQEGLKLVQKYTWDIIAERYYNEIYKELLETLS